MSEPHDLSTPYRPATDAQLKVLEQAQREAGLDMTRLFPYLSSLECDCLVKGCILIHQVIKMTGQRFIAPRDIRRAVWAYLDTHSPDPEK